MDQATPVRRTDIDALRVFATYLLLVFHTAMVFNPAPFYHIRNSEQSFLILIFCGFIGLWHMPLFFLLAGWSAFSSLTARSGKEFLRERFLRLFVPLVAGCVLLMPPIKFLELSNGFDANYTGLYVDPSVQGDFREIIPSGLPVAPAFDERFFEFLPTFFSDATRFTWAHLWFVAYLLTFTIIYLPLLQYIRRRQWFRHAPSALWVYAPALPLALVQVTMRQRWPGLQNLVDDWANFAYYSIFLLCGFVIACFPRFEAAIHRERNRALVIAAAATGVLLLGVLGVISSPAVILAHTAIAGWCFVIALLGWARARIRATGPLLRYLQESAFPVYLLHQSAIVIPGYFLIQSSLGLWTKWGLLLCISTISTIAAYHLLVRPFALPRFLCGMKPRPSGRATVQLPATATEATAALCLAMTVAALCAPGSTIAERTGMDPAGRWYAEGGAAQVEINDCGGQLCGTVVWLRSPFDEDGCPMRAPAL